MKKPRPSLSVVLATFNEQENITKCLTSVKHIANEIIVVDGSSSDKTRQLAKKAGAKVTKTTNPSNFHINKQKALDLATGKWILQLDADEIVSEELSQEIKSVIKFSDSQIISHQNGLKNLTLFLKHQSLIEKRDGKVGSTSGQITAFYIPRLNIFLGKPLRHTGVYPDGVIRLVKNGHAKFPCVSVHEQIQVKGRTSWLENDLIHYDSPTFSKYLTRANRYTTLTAKDLDRNKLPIGLFTILNYLVYKPVITFLSLFFRHKGFLDGYPGFVFSLFSGLHHSIAYMKYWEMRKI